MNEIERAIEIAKIKQICEFCVDTSDENCFNCKKVKPIPLNDLKVFYETVIQALQEKYERENKTCSNCANYKNLPDCKFNKRIEIIRRATNDCAYFKEGGAE